MEIKLVTNAFVLGVLRGPTERGIDVPAAEAHRLVDAKLANFVDAKAGKKPAKAAPKKARTKRAPTTKAADPAPAASPAPPPASEAPEAPAAS